RAVRVQGPHVDVGRGGPDAEAAELQQAYDVLSDDDRRRTYDQFGVVDGASAAGPRGAARGAAGVDFDDLGSMFDAFFNGRGPGAGTRGHKPRARRGRDLRQEITVSFMAAALGGTETLRMEGRTIDVIIPAGIDDGATLRVRHEGAQGTGGGPRGDLLLTVRVGSHPVFRRGDGPAKGLDLTLTLPLTIAEAALGAVVRVPTLDGTVDLTVPPGTGSGRRLRLRGRGISKPSGEAGNLYAVVAVVVPGTDALTDDEAEALRSAAAKTPGVRTGDGWPKEVDNSGAG
ncbi:MAG: DnaJ C-terminal domain-containing protein, partial [Planctomycetota bacterium]